MNLLGSLSQNGSQAFLVLELHQLRPECLGHRLPGSFLSQTSGRNTAVIELERKHFYIDWLSFP